jgi:lysophospholipase L1-like esterase
VTRTTGPGHVGGANVRVGLLVIAPGYVFSFVLLTVSASQRWALGVIIGAVFLLLTSIGLTLMVRRLMTHRLARLVFTIAVTMLAVGGLLIWLYFDSDRADGLLSRRLTEGWGFVGGCLAILGAGQLLTLARRTRHVTLVRGIVLVAACAAAFLIGLLAPTDGIPGWAAWLMAAGVLLSPIGLGLLTEDVVARFADRRMRPTRRTGLILLGGGAAAVAVGVWLLVSAAGIQFWYAALVALVLAGLVGAVASNTPADVVLVAAVLALIWSIIPRGADPTPEVQPVAGESAMVAFGDSFISGEGAKRFYEGTNNKDHNECRRAPTAYPPVTVSGDNPLVPDHLAFVACSGARAIDIYGRAQEPGDPIDGPDGGLNQLDHVGWLQDRVKLDVKLVIVSIGGNDAQFGSIAQACVAPGDCTEVGARWLDDLADVAPTVHEAYQKVRDYFGPRVPIVVVPYPIPLNPTKCDWSLLTENEHVFLHGYTVELNKVLRRSASDAGLYYLGEMTRVFDAKNLRICDDSARRVGVNFFAMNSVTGLIRQSLNPQNWLHNSLHPNERGHQAMAEALNEWITTHPDPVERLDPPPSAEQDVAPIESIETIMGDPDFRHCGNDPSIPHCQAQGAAWAQAQLVTLARRIVGPLLLVVAGAWAVWVWLIWWWRDRRRAREERTPAEPAV